MVVCAVCSANVQKLYLNSGGESHLSYAIIDDVRDRVHACSSVYITAQTSAVRYHALTVKTCGTEQRFIAQWSAILLHRSAVPGSTPPESVSKKGVTDAHAHFSFIFSSSPRSVFFVCVCE